MPITILSDIQRNCVSDDASVTGTPFLELNTCPTSICVGITGVSDWKASISPSSSRSSHMSFCKGLAVSGFLQVSMPPAMARMWSLLHAAFGGTSEPMFVAQMVLYWAGFGLIAAALARLGRGGAAAAVLAIGALPLFLGWQAVVLKDTQMLGAVLAACGAVAWWRLRGARVPVWALIAVGLQNSFAGVGLLALAGAGALISPTLRAGRGK